MRRSKLDRIDRKILRNLQNEGRMSNVNLAKEVGISAPPCLRRVRALEDAGIIKSYHANVNAPSLGYTVLIYAQVKLNSQADSELEAFEKFANEEPMIRECTLLAGDIDFILKIVAKDWDAYQEFHKNTLTSAPSVVSVKSSFINPGC